MSQYPFSPLEVVGLIFKNNEIKPAGREIQVPCPVCHDHKKRLYINTVSGKTYCHNCGFNGNVVELYRQTYDIPEWKDAFVEILKRLGLHGKPFEVNRERKAAQVPVVEEVPLAPIDTRDAVYRSFLKELTLTPKHQKDLLERGFTRVRLYRTTPDKKDLANIIKQMGVKEVGGVPGFYKHKKSGFPGISKCSSGIFVPYLSMDEKVQGLQIRIDDELVSENKSKYIWFSSLWASNSKFATDGSGGSFIHYACDFENGKAVFPVSMKTGEKSVVITEGAMKADLAHQISKRPFIALPGVNATRNVEAELKKLKEEGVHTIWNAFDMDYITNDQVRKASEKLETLIKDLGFEYKRANWNPKYKGIDDYLYALKQVIG